MDFGNLATVSFLTPQLMTIAGLAVIVTCLLTSLVLAESREMRLLASFTSMILNGFALIFVLSSPLMVLSGAMVMAPLSVIFVALLRPAVPQPPKLNR